MTENRFLILYREFEAEFSKFKDDRDFYHLLLNQHLYFIDAPKFIEWISKADPKDAMAFCLYLIRRFKESADIVNQAVNP